MRWSSDIYNFFSSSFPCLMTTVISHSQSASELGRCTFVNPSPLLSRMTQEAAYLGCVRVSCCLWKAAAVSAGPSSNTLGR